MGGEARALSDIRQLERGSFWLEIRSYIIEGFCTAISLGFSSTKRDFLSIARRSSRSVEEKGFVERRVFSLQNSALFAPPCARTPLERPSHTLWCACLCHRATARALAQGGALPNLSLPLPGPPHGASLLGVAARRTAPTTRRRRRRRRMWRRPLGRLRRRQKRRRRIRSTQARTGSLQAWKPLKRGPGVETDVACEPTGSRCARGVFSLCITISLCRKPVS